MGGEVLWEMEQGENSEDVLHCKIAGDVFLYTCNIGVTGFDLDPTKAMFI